MKVSSFRFVFSHRQEKVKPSKCSKNALGSSSPGIWINFKAGRAESCSCSFRPPAGVDPGGRIGGASGQLRGADVGACAAAVIFLLRSRVFSVQQHVIFFFFFLLLSVRQKARGRRRKRKTLSLSLCLFRKPCPASPAAASRRPSASPRAWPTATRAMRGEEKKKGKECCERRKIIRGSE